LGRSATKKKTVELKLNILYVIRDPVGNNKNSIANCIFYLTKKSNQPEDGSQLEPKHVVERNNVRNTP
jgi:hypothetical protein